MLLPAAIVDEMELCSTSCWLYFRDILTMQEHMNVKRGYKVFNRNLHTGGSLKQTIQQEAF
jgi:hypothetical protein